MAMTLLELLVVIIQYINSILMTVSSVSMIVWPIFSRMKRNRIIIIQHIFRIQRVRYVRILGVFDWKVINVIITEGQSTGYNIIKNDLVLIGWTEIISFHWVKTAFILLFLPIFWGSSKSDITFQGGPLSLFGKHTTVSSMMYINNVIQTRQRTPFGCDILHVFFLRFIIILVNHMVFNLLKYNCDINHMTG